MAPQGVPEGIVRSRPVPGTALSSGLRPAFVRSMPSKEPLRTAPLSITVSPRERPTALEVSTNRSRMNPVPVAASQSQQRPQVNMPQSQLEVNARAGRASLGEILTPTRRDRPDPANTTQPARRSTPVPVSHQTLATRERPKPVMTTRTTRRQGMNPAGVEPAERQWKPRPPSDSKPLRVSDL